MSPRYSWTNNRQSWLHDICAGERSP